MKICNTLLTLALATLALSFAGCTSTEPTYAQMTPEQIDALFNQDRANLGNNVEESDKQNRFLSSSIRTVINSDPNQRALSKFDYDFNLSSNFASQGLEEAAIRWNRSERLEVTEGEILNVPVGGEILIGKQAVSSGDGIADQNRSWAERDAVIMQGKAAIAQIDSDTRRAINETRTGAVLNGYLRTVEGVENVTGKVISMTPIGATNGILSRGLDILDDKTGAPKTVTLVAPSEGAAQ